MIWTKMFPVGPLADDTVSNKVATGKTSVPKPLSIREKNKNAKTKTKQNKITTFPFSSCIYSVVLKLDCTLESPGEF